MKTRILIADDQRLVLEGVASLLRDQYEVVETATEAPELLEKALRTRPEVIVLDAALRSGLEALKQVRREAPEIRAVILTSLEDPRHVRAAFRAGASGYVLKRSGSSELKMAVEAATQGKEYASPLLSEVGRRDVPAPGEYGRLTPRQREVLALVAEGLPAKKIAARLQIARKTVEFHKASIMGVLGVRNTPEMVRYAVERGLLEIQIPATKTAAAGGGSAPAS